MATASFRFYGALNDFLPRALRHATLVARVEAGATVKDLVEALGVPHPEIDRLVVDGAAVGFGYLVRPGDRVAAYPPFSDVALGEDGRLTPPPQAVPTFVADVHLGRLAAYLRLAGVDTSYETDATDHDLAAISSLQDRTLLTRDVGLLKHRTVTRGYFVRQTQPARQLVEVLARFDLPRSAVPFTRCGHCNGVLAPAAKPEVLDRLPPRTRELYDAFWECPGCRQVYWEGSHHARIRAFLDGAFAEAARVRRS